MPASPSVLSSLIQTNMAANFKAVTGTDPLTGKETQYFENFCLSFGTGIATGTPNIPFTTADSGESGVPPVAGAGTGTGVIVNSTFFEQTIYTNVRAAILSQFGRTNNIAYPPTTIGNGLVLQAMAKAIADAVTTHYATVWTLASVNPQIYAGTGSIRAGYFSGISSSLVKTDIIAAGPLMGTGSKSAFPGIAGAVATAYATAITDSTSGATGSVTITGSCVVSPGQVCGVPSTGNGTGTAT